MLTARAVRDLQVSTGPQLEAKVHDSMVTNITTVFAALAADTGTSTPASYAIAHGLPGDLRPVAAAIPVSAAGAITGAGNVGKRQFR